MAKLSVTSEDISLCQIPNWNVLRFFVFNMFLHEHARTQNFHILWIRWKHNFEVLSHARVNVTTYRESSSSYSLILYRRTIGLLVKAHAYFLLNCVYSCRVLSYPFIFLVTYCNLHNLFIRIFTSNKFTHTLC